MQLRHFICGLFVSLGACTHQQVEININRANDTPVTAGKSNGSPSIDVVASKNSDVKVRINGDPQTEKPPGAAQSIVTEKPQEGLCPKYTPPKLKPTPKVPIEIDERRKMSDEKIIGLLTEYARDLRKTSIQNQTMFEMSYAEYLNSCKK